jgi:ABC-type proline/glycine betaine transport system substrate-binding protein
MDPNRGWVPAWVHRSAGLRGLRREPRVETDAAQGFHFAQPMPVERVEDYLAEQFDTALGQVIAFPA